LAGANRGPVGGSRRGRAQSEVCATRSWTWCRTGLLRLWSGRCGFDSHLGWKIQWLSGPSA